MRMLHAMESELSRRGVPRQAMLTSVMDSHVQSAGTHYART